MAYVDILFWLIVAIIIFVRLNGLLGSRPGNEKVIIVNKEKAKEIIEALSENTLEGLPETEPLSDMDITLSKIPDFNKDLFLKGASRAFEIIIKAFAEEDLETLKFLTTKKIYSKFEEIILQRHADGQVAETDFVGFDKTEIIDAKITKTLAKISVNFISEQVNVLKDSDGKIIKGDENFVQKIDDVWTFERDLNKQSNVWLLASTKK